MAYRRLAKSHVIDTRIHVASLPGNMKQPLGSVHPSPHYLQFLASETDSSCLCLTLQLRTHCASVGFLKHNQQLRVGIRGVDR